MPTAPICCEWLSAASRRARSLRRMVSALLCNAVCSFVDSPFHRSTTSLNRDAATPPQIDGGTLIICPMNDCSIARISSLRASIFPATAVIRSKSVLSDAPTGVVIEFLSMIFVSVVFSTQRGHVWFPRSYKCVRRANRFLADVVADERAPWSALASDPDSHGVVDQHRPVD